MTNTLNDMLTDDLKICYCSFSPFNNKKLLFCLLTYIKLTYFDFKNLTDIVILIDKVTMRGILLFDRLPILKFHVISNLLMICQ
jgi:hypothetical protein